MLYFRPAPIVNAHLLLPVQQAASSSGIPTEHAGRPQPPPPLHTPQTGDRRAYEHIRTPGGSSNRSGAGESPTKTVHFGGELPPSSAPTPTFAAPPGLGPSTAAGPLTPGGVPIVTLDATPSRPMPSSSQAPPSAQAQHQSRLPVPVEGARTTQSP